MDEIRISDHAPNHDPKPGLGKTLAYFPVEGWAWKRWLLVISGGVLTIGSFFFLIYLGFEANTAIQRHGRAVLLGYLPMPFVPVLVLFPLGGLFIFMAWLNWQNGITLYEKGLHQQKRHRTHICLWEDIVRLDTRVIKFRFSGSNIASNCWIVLEDQQNHQWTIHNHYEQMDQLINRIRRGVIPIIYQKMINRLIDGDAIIFSKKLQAIRNGLKIKGAFSPWHILDMPEISKGKFLLKHKDTQALLFKTKIDHIRNLDSLIYLIKNPPPSTDQSSPK